MIPSMVSKLGTAPTGSSYAEEQKLRNAAEKGVIGEVVRLIESGVSVNSNDGVSSNCTCTCVYIVLCILPSNPIYRRTEFFLFLVLLLNRGRIIHVLIKVERFADE